MRCVLVTIALVLAASSVSAQVPSTLELGGGLSVRALPRYCGGTVASGCFAWEPVGFTFGDQPALPFATTFARVPSTGRLLAALPPASTLYAPIGFTTRLLASDDGGAHWTEVRWRWVESVTRFAFDAGTAHGVAAGDSGYLWETTDGGRTWTEHGSATGTTYVELAIHEGIVIAIDSARNVWRAPHGNFDRDLLVAATSTPHVAVVDDALVVTTDSETIRLRRGRAVERTRR